MRGRTLSLLPFCLFWAGFAIAEALVDRPLPVVPRTPQEEARVAAILAPPADFSRPEPFEAKSGGAAGVAAGTTRNVFSEPSGNMAFDRQMEFRLGNAIFRKTWVAAPASTKASDGLGPYYNARSCQDCHLKDGRGQLPDAGEQAVGLLMRLALPGGQMPLGIPDYLPTVGDPQYGGQLQTFAAPGLVREAGIGISYTEEKMTLSDGLVVSLRRPAYSLTEPAMGAPAPGLMMSPRLAPQMIGLGLLEAVSAGDILAGEDASDADGDGISGRANMVLSQEFGVPMAGRFGWKAGQPTLAAQGAAAFANDMGLSNVLHPDPYGDCTAVQTDCRSAAAGQEPGIRDGLEVNRESLDIITFYSRNLAVPERRNVDAPQVLRGKAVFHDLGCASCHTPKFVTQRLADQPEQSFQLIWPYTDLLLHDMGDGLADGLTEGRATGREWRTAPLWGIGLTAQVTERTEFLHDGRARSLLEAVLWHGGEAAAARDRVVALPKADRDALMAFLESL
jgi:CxxC motif-containing protein (DUF1111 family)